MRLRAGPQLEVANRTRGVLHQEPHDSHDERLVVIDALAAQTHDVPVGRSQTCIGDAVGDPLLERYVGPVELQDEAMLWPTELRVADLLGLDGDAHAMCGSPFRVHACMLTTAV